MPDEGYMDAAAVPVPDAGDDTLRERLAETLHAVDKKGAASDYGVTFRDWSALPEPAREDYYEYADALLPRIREHMASPHGGNPVPHRLAADREEAIREARQSRSAAEKAVRRADQAKDDLQSTRHELLATMQQLHIAASRAETAETELKRLTDWKESAMTTLSGLQDLGQELGLPLGESITGTLATETAHGLRDRAETAEAAIERARAVLGDAHEVIDRGGIRREACIPADRVRAALDGTEAD